MKGKPISHKDKKVVKGKPHIRTISMGITGKTQKIAVKKSRLRTMEVVNSANSEFSSDFFLTMIPSS